MVKQHPSPMQYTEMLQNSKGEKVFFANFEFHLFLEERLAASM